MDKLFSVDRFPYIVRYGLLPIGIVGLALWGWDGLGGPDFNRDGD